MLCELTVLVFHEMLDVLLALDGANTRRDEIGISAGKERRESKAKQW